MKAYCTSWLIFLILTYFGNNVPTLNCSQRAWFPRETCCCSIFLPLDVALFPECNNVDEWIICVHCCCVVFCAMAWSVPQPTPFFLLTFQLGRGRRLVWVYANLSQAAVMEKAFYHQIAADPSQRLVCLSRNVSISMSNEMRKLKSCGSLWLWSK